MRSSAEETKAPRARARGAFVSVLVLLMAALVAPPIVLISAWCRDAETAVEQRAAIFALDRSAKSVSVGASATLSWTPALQVRSPDWNGLVTEVIVAPGDTPQPGDPLGRIDGVLIRYFILDIPLYRPTCTNDSALVDQVRTILRTFNYPVGATGTLSRTDVRSIREYAKDIGVADVSALDCFSPTWVASSTQAIGPVSEVALNVSAPAPARGDPILVGRTTLKSVSLRGTTGSQSLDESLDAEGAKAFAGTELLVNGVPSGVGLGAIDDPAALSLLAANFDPKIESTTIAVVVTLTESQYVVPSTAVIDALAAQPCVEDVASTSTVPVHVVNSSVSGLIVDFGDIGAVDSISVSPEHSSCG